MHSNQAHGKVFEAYQTLKWHTKQVKGSTNNKKAHLKKAH
jgi:hypothetical protein